VFTFLELLYVHDHHQVLEIGTGTGWTAALLSWRVGAENVTTIELDEQVAAQAAINLKASCYSPRQVVGDGAKGWPEGAPYDRVHVTCGVRDIPYAWVEQTRPGGIIALPWSPGYAFGHRVRLDVMPDGTAMGRFAGSAGYMMLRSQRSPDVTYDGDATETTTRVDPRSVAWDSYGADTAIAGTLPGLFSREDKRDDGSFLLWLEEAGGSWASVEYRPHRTLYEVRQAGNRQLWDEVEAAYFRWQSWGRPERSRFGMTVTPDGQRLWLDDPRRVIGAE
jgi:protein-L-isoaspartate(D-aspartate) O-methyltransferase